MPPKDYVPPKIYVRLSDGTVQEIDNESTTVGEIETWGERYDFIHVVRCKNCKYYKIAQLKKDYTPDERYKPSVCTNGQFAIRRDPEWYCADGKRKGEDNEDCSN